MKPIVSLAVASVVFVASLSSGVRADPPAVQPKPNVLFIAIDDLRDWVGYLGHQPVRTPHLDRFAARGVRFTRSYCAAPVCNPSRTALLTGMRPSTSGVYDNGTDWRKVVPADAVTLPRHFANHGYYVAGAGKIFHGAYERNEDWTDYYSRRRAGAAEPAAKAKAKQAAGKDDGGVGGIRFKPLDAADEDMNDFHTVNYIVDQLQKQRDRPFFLACGLQKPHMPWDVPRKYYDIYPLESVALPKILENDLDDIPPAGVRMARPEGDHADMLKSGRWREAVQAYLATITFTDAMIGRLIDGLDRSPHNDNTIVVLWSDHGWHLGEKQHWRKFALWEEATRAPLLWVVPGLTKPDSMCDRTVDFMHIYPTLCDLAGLPTPKHVEGPSIRSLLADPGANWNAPAVTTHLFANHAIRSARWRYIRYQDGSEELYDEVADPLEWSNLAGKPEHAATKSELARWLPKTNAAPGQAVRGGNRR